MLKIELDKEQTYASDYKIKVKKSRKYSVTTKIVGYSGKPFCGYFGVIFHNKNNRELERKIHWLNDFSGKSKQLKIIFSAKTESISLIYRINIETDFSSNCNFEILPIKEIIVNEEKPQTKEFFHTINDYSLPKLDDLSSEDEEILEKNLVWVFGFPRSGTTWLALQLLSHNSKSINELHIEKHLGSREEQISHKLVRRIDHMKKIPSYFFSSRYKETWNYFLKKLILNRIFAQVRETSKKIIIKEPGGDLGAIDVIADCLPNSKLIILARDGRDVIDSLIDARKTDGFMSEFGETAITSENRISFITSQAKFWTTYTQKLLELHKSSHKVLLVKYENLLKNTFKELKTVYKFLEIKISDDKIKDIINKYSFEKIPQKQKGTGKFYRSAKTELWKKNFSPYEKKIMHDIMANTLTKLGYEEFNLSEIQTKSKITLKETKSSDLHPLSALLKIYNQRMDLQKEFPEVSRGEFTRFIDWAYNLLSSNLIGEEKTKLILSKYVSWFSLFLNDQQNQQMKIREEKSALESSLDLHKKDIDSLQQEKSALESSLDLHKKDIDSLQQEKSALESSLDLHKKDIDSLQQEKSALENSLDLHKKELELIKTSKGFKGLRFVGSKIDKIKKKKKTS